VFLPKDPRPSVPLTAIFRSHLPSNYFSRDRALAFFQTGGPSHQLGGLINIGYNCYVNAVLQALAYTPGFSHFCLHLPNVIYQRNSSAAFFLDSLGRIFSELNSRRSTSPTWILQDAGQLADRFRRPLQQDSHEFLLHLLDALDGECIAALPGGGDTMISQYFACELTVTLTCCSCGASSSRETKCHDIGVPMREFSDVEAAVRAITSAAAITVPGQCEYCGTRDQLVKANHFTSLPLILIVTLMRFDNALTKVEDFLSFPKTLVVQGRYEYELYALVLHNGRLISHGHFVALVRDQQENWYRADDVCVYRMKEDAVFTSCPYVLFYKRINL
jgi:uncharacterized UBP type Zn finger protein